MPRRAHPKKRRRRQKAKAMKRPRSWHHGARSPEAKAWLRLETTYTHTQEPR